MPPGASICPPAVPSARAPVLIEEVAFGILTSERYLATRLQAYGHQGAPPVGANVLHAVADCLTQLRTTSVLIVEAMVAWQAAAEASRQAGKANKRRPV